MSKQARKVRIMDVTPEVAAKWLNKNTHNRPIRDHLVKDYAFAMKRGEWKLTPEPIAFSRPFVDATGKHCAETLIEGQHRLWAIVDSGVTCKMTVWFNCESDEFSVIGQGAERTQGDILSLTRPDIKDSTLVASTCTAFFRHAVGGKHTVDAWMVRKLLAHAQADIEIVADYKKQLKKLAPRAVTAALVLGQMVNPAQTGVLVRQLKDAIGFTERDPARALHLYLHAQQAATNRDTTDVTFYRTVNAVSAKLQGSQLKILRISADGLAWLRDAARPKLTPILMDIFGQVPKDFWNPRLVHIEETNEDEEEQKLAS